MGRTGGPPLVMTVLLQNDDARLRVSSRTRANIPDHVVRRLSEKPFCGRPRWAVSSLSGSGIGGSPSRRPGRPAVDRRVAGRAGGFPADLGAVELRVAGGAAAAAPGGSDLARPDRRADPAVAVQARRPADDGDVCRRDDHRHRYLHVPADGLPGPGLEGRSRDHRRLGRAGGALARRSVPRRPADRAGRSPGLLRGPCLPVVFRADRPGARILAARLRLQVHAFGRGRGRRSDDARRHRGRCLCGDQARRRRRRHLSAGRKTAAHRHGFRRVRASTPA